MNCHTWSNFERLDSQPSSGVAMSPTAMEVFPTPLHVPATTTVLILRTWLRYTLQCILQQLLQPLAVLPEAYRREELLCKVSPCVPQPTANLLPELDNFPDPESEWCIKKPPLAPQAAPTERSCAKLTAPVASRQRND